MLASDLDELHTLAAKIGLRRDWFQEEHTFPHYDLTASKRRLALQHGAIPIGLGEVPDDVLMCCKDGTYETKGQRFARRASSRQA